MTNANAIAALEAASRVHQRAGGTKGKYGGNEGGTADDSTVLATARTFYDWLEDKSR